MELGGFQWWGLSMVGTALQGGVGRLCTERHLFLQVSARVLSFQMWALEKQISLHSREILGCKGRRRRGYPGD